MRAASRLARRLAAVIAECHYAQQRILALRVAPDSYLSGAAAARTPSRTFSSGARGRSSASRRPAPVPPAGGWQADQAPSCATDLRRDLPPDGQMSYYQLGNRVFAADDPHGIIS
jgi:hypothetical protein